MKRHILLLEDDLVQAEKYMRFILSSNYTYWHETNGECVLKPSFVCKNYDGLIIDVQMPGVDGFAVVEALAKMNCNIPCLLQSSLAGRLITERYGSLAEFESKFPFVTVLFKHDANIPAFLSNLVG